MGYGDSGHEYVLMSKENRWIFVPIWKNATKSIFYSFAKQHSTYVSENKHAITFFFNDDTKDPKMYHKESRDYIDNINSFYSFTCIRNPIDRFFSAFFHKVVLHPEGPEAKVFLDKYMAHSDEPFIKLDKFTAHLLNDKEIDAHFLTQTLIGDFNKISYNKILTIENLTNDWTNLQSECPGLPRLIESKLHKTESAKFHFEMSKQKGYDRIITRINKFYQDDIELFNKNSLHQIGL